tara:strand:- start:3038 stop:3793 length:756 start_codon:yes stop_codon:yes gene_type:complete
MDLKKVDKKGNQLNLVPHANKHKFNDYYQMMLADSSSVEPSMEDIKCELQLNSLNMFEKLSFHIRQKIEDELDIVKDMWVPYLRREGIMNDREGISLFGIKGMSIESGLSMPEVKKFLGRTPSELEFTEPTEAYFKLKALHPIIEYFQPVARTYLVKLNKGGFFPPHKDTPLLNRETFRIVAFLSEQNLCDNFEWEMDGRKQKITQYASYYVDTKQTHRTHSWDNDNIHLIMNIPKTWDNVMKLMSKLDSA